MLTITLICNLGMSTSMLVDKMKAAANEKGIEADIDALPFDKMGDRVKKTDILLLGPQVRYLLSKFKAEYGSDIPVIEVMNFSDYALINAEKILNESLAKLKTNKP